MSAAEEPAGRGEGPGPGEGPSAPRAQPLPSAGAGGAAGAPEAAQHAAEEGDATAAGADEAGLPRRRFLGAAALCLGGGAGAALLGAVGAAVVGTPLAAEGGPEPGWFDLGPLERFPPGEAVLVPVFGEARDAWALLPRRALGQVIVQRASASPDARVEVLSSVCPHNGCAARVEGASLLCPCHGSRFGRDGQLVSGTSPRGLDPLEARVAEGRVLVRYRRFQVGVAERRPV